jgi:hypothetical protein
LPRLILIRKGGGEDVSICATLSHLFLA